MTPYLPLEVIETNSRREGRRYWVRAREAAGVAASRANDARVARAKVCPGCGRIEALGHFALCLDDPDFIARKAKSEGER